MEIIVVIWKILMYMIFLHWTIITGFVLLGLSGLIFYKNNNQVSWRSNRVDLVIVSKANYSVKNALFNCIRYHANKFPYLTIHLVVDEGSGLTRELERSAKENNVNLIIVPNDFKCKAIAKGRAIEYFIRNYVQEDKWYCYIDDDNRITDDNFLYEIPYYDIKGYKLSNCVLKPRKGKSTISYIADHIRYFDDKFIFRFFTGLTESPINGVHGELLLAKGDILKHVGFDRKTITEDFAFARECIKIGVKSWQSSTIVSILSPNSINDFIKQRNRWYKGIKKDLNNAPLTMKILGRIRIFDWKWGIVGSWIFVPLWIFFGFPLYAIVFCLIGASYYYIAYIWGVARSGNPVYLLLIPFYAIMENIAPFYPSKEDHFAVINKN